MTKSLLGSNGATRVASILGVPLADDVVRQWPQMGEVVRTRQLVAEAEGNFPELTLEVGRRLQLDNVVRVTDYRGEPTVTPDVAPAHDRSSRYAGRRHLARLRRAPFKRR